MTWDRVRLKHLCEDAGQYGINVSTEDYSEDGTRMIRTSDITEKGTLKPAPAVRVNANIPPRQLIRAGDVLLSRSGTLGRSLLVGKLENDTTFAGYLVRFRPASGIHPRYLWYATMSSAFRASIAAEAVSSTIQNFNAERYSNIELITPGIDEQRAIVRYLDSEVGRLDEIGRLREVQAASLLELEQSKIGDALGGKTSPCRRKTTGWTWLPTIPDQWGIQRASRHFDIKLGKMLDAGRSASAQAVMAPYLRNANVSWFDVTTLDMSSMTFEPSEFSRYSVRDGDLLVCEGGAGVGEAAVWDGRIDPCYFQKSLHRVRATSRLPVEWLMYWLRYAKYVGVFHADGNLSTIPHLTGEQLSEYRIPVPNDPKMVLRELEKELSMIRRVRRALVKADLSLAERRTAVITAAVTGQIDVPTARGVDV